MRNRGPFWHGFMFWFRWVPSSWEDLGSAVGMLTLIILVALLMAALVFGT